MSTRLAVVLLAAGVAQRYGSAKQVERIDGISLVRRAALAALAVCGEVLVVTGAHSDAVDAALEGLALRRVKNDDWALGMGHSIACGFRALLAQADPADAALLCLCDQPRVGAASLQRLIDAHRSALQKIIVADYGAQRGPPCLFPAEFYPELTTLRGDLGARDVLKRHADRVDAIAIPDGAFDVDTPADLERLRQL